MTGLRSLSLTKRNRHNSRSSDTSTTAAELCLRNKRVSPTTIQSYLREADAISYFDTARQRWLRCGRLFHCHCRGVCHRTRSSSRLASSDSGGIVSLRGHERNCLSRCLGGSFLLLLGDSGHRLLDRMRQFPQTGLVHRRNRSGPWRSWLRLNDLCLGYDDAVRKRCSGRIDFGSRNAVGCRAAASLFETNS